ncbi:MAG: hypothetical protein R3D71_02525 [Rickettsiales bacterium]
MDSNKYNDVAKEFMELWQKQMTSVMGDKQFIHAMLDFFHNLQTTAESQTQKNNDNKSTDTSDTSDAQRRVLDELTFRLAMCEKRLSDLEKGKHTTRRTTKSGKRGSKKPDK